MQIHTFKLDKYRNCAVYYRNFKDHFEYFTVIKKELYTAHITVRPHWITKILHTVGIEKMQYSDQQLKAIISQLRRLAQTTIDFVLDGEKKKVV